MLLTFSKYEGTGNDFIMLDGRETPPPLGRKVIAKLCDRHRGIGADGLMVLQTSPSDESDCLMHYYNADGSRGEMCGNGGRCFALYMEHLGIGESLKRIAADDGAHLARLVDKRGAEGTVELGIIHAGGIETCGKGWFLNTGVPHYVELVDDPERIDVQGLGSAIRHDKRFAEGTNVNFIRITGPGTIAIRTYERGVEAETLSCGTGSAASALVVNRFFQPECTSFNVVTRGGQLRVAFDAPSGETYRRIRLQGAARRVFEGRIEI